MGALGARLRIHDSADRIHRLPVNAGAAGHVFGVLEAALDFERRHASPHEIGQHFDAREILRAEEVLAVAELDLVAVGDEIVGQTAGLRALAAVGGAPAQRFAGETLA